VVSATHNNKGL